MSLVIHVANAVSPSTAVYQTLDRLNRESGSCVAFSTAPDLPEVRGSWTVHDLDGMTPRLLAFLIKTAMTTADHAAIAIIDAHGGETAAHYPGPLHTPRPRPYWRSVLRDRRRAINVRQALVLAHRMLHNLAMTDAPEPAVAARDRRDAMVADHLARGVRDGYVIPEDALCIIRHELRRRNTNKKLDIIGRSREAQRVIDEHRERNAKVPQNGSHDALHADHVYKLTEKHLRELYTVDAWITELSKLRQVVCVTERENMRLEQIEQRDKIDGPEKYPLAGIEWADGRLPEFLATPDD
jgi:hypothetical protein